MTSLHDNLQHTTTIIDDQGKAGTLYSQKDLVPIEQISPNIQHAIVSTEDKRFMSHRGFDVIGISRAAVGYVLGRNCGWWKYYHNNWQKMPI